MNEPRDSEPRDSEPGNNETPDRDERVYRLCEELIAAKIDPRTVAFGHWAERFEVDESEVQDCLALLETLEYAFDEDLPSPAADDDRAPPELPADYCMVEELGRGGMGVVYRVEQQSLGREVALKILRPGEVFFGDAIQRFRNEARSLARLRHRHIVRVHEVGEVGSHVYFTMDLIDGRSLDALIREGRITPSRITPGRITPSRAVKILRQVTSAVAYAHSKGIVHRDLKPSNILIDEHGDAFVVDFGLALDVGATGDPTLTGQVLGTPAYMSPEQALGDRERIGEASDVYALGTVLYECLTGQPPFRGKPFLELMQAVVHDDPVAVRQLEPKVPLDLEIICAKAMAKEPDRRYASATALLGDLERFQEGRPITGAKVPRAWRWRRSLARQRQVLFAVLATVLVLLPLLWLTVDTLQRRSAQRWFDQATEWHRDGRYEAALDIYRRLDEDPARLPETSRIWSAARQRLHRAHAAVRAGKLAESQRIFATSRDELAAPIDTPSFRRLSSRVQSDWIRDLIACELGSGAPTGMLQRLGRLTWYQQGAPREAMREGLARGEVSTEEAYWTLFEDATYDGPWRWRLALLLATARDVDGPFYDASCFLIAAQGWKASSHSSRRIFRRFIDLPPGELGGALRAFLHGMTLHPLAYNREFLRWELADFAELLCQRGGAEVSEALDEVVRAEPENLIRAQLARLLAHAADIPVSGLGPGRRQRVLESYEALRGLSRRERFHRGMEVMVTRIADGIFPDREGIDWIYERATSTTGAKNLFSDLSQWWDRHGSEDPRRWLLENLKRNSTVAESRALVESYLQGALPEAEALPRIITAMTQEPGTRATAIWHHLASLVAPESMAVPVWRPSLVPSRHRALARWRRLAGLEPEPYLLRIFHVAFARDSMEPVLHWQGTLPVPMGETRELNVVTGSEVGSIVPDPGFPDGSATAFDRFAIESRRIAPPIDGEVRLPGLIRPAVPRPVASLPVELWPSLHVRASVDVRRGRTVAELEQFEVFPWSGDLAHASGLPIPLGTLVARGALILLLERPGSPSREWTIEDLANRIVQELETDGEELIAADADRVELALTDNVRSLVALARWMPLPKARDILTRLSSVDSRWRPHRLFESRLLAGDGSVWDEFPDHSPSPGVALALLRDAGESAVHPSVFETLAGTRLTEQQGRWIRRFEESRGLSLPPALEDRLATIEVQGFSWRGFLIRGWWVVLGAIILGALTVVALRVRREPVRIWGVLLGVSILFAMAEVRFWEVPLSPHVLGAAFATLAAIMLTRQVGGAASLVATAGFGVATATALVAAGGTAYGGTAYGGTAPSVLDRVSILAMGLGVLAVPFLAARLYQSAHSSLPGAARPVWPRVLLVIALPVVIVDAVFLAQHFGSDAALTRWASRPDIYGRVATAWALWLIVVVAYLVQRALVSRPRIRFVRKPRASGE